MDRKATRAEKVLEETISTIWEEENWIQHTMAQDEDGKATSFKDEDACKFCLAGAFKRAVSNRGYYNEIGEVNLAASLLEDAIEDCWPKIDETPAYRNNIELAINFNDHHKTSHADVVTALEEAIYYATTVANEVIVPS